METNSVRRDGTPFNNGEFVTAIRSVVPRERVRGTGYGHSDGTTWDVKHDGSCGFEIASPAMMMDDAGECIELKNVCAQILTVQPQINRQCGLHVHVEVLDYTWDDMRRLLALWTRYEPFFFELLPPSRRHNTYCKPLRKSVWTAGNSPSWPSVDRSIDARDERTFRSTTLFAGDRYHALNIDHFWSAGRIEFRLHSGTIDYVKIRNWVRLLLALVQRVKQGSMPRISKVDANDRNVPFTTYYVLKVLGLIRSKYVPDVAPECEDLVNWCEARRRLFDGTVNRTGRRGRAVANEEPGEELGSYARTTGEV
jgi:hypothetical protein